MFSVIVEEKIITYSEHQAKSHNFGQRHTANGTFDQQLTGLIGQCTIQNLFRLSLVDGKDGFDNGVDFIYNGLTVDVKTMGRTTDVRSYYVNNFIGLQMYFKTDAYIFCSLNKVTSKLTVCGWCSKVELKDKARFYKKGTIRKRSDGSVFNTFADLYEIDNNDLHDVDSIVDLENQLNSYANNISAS